MNSQQRHRVAMIGGFACGGILVVGSVLLSGGEGEHPAVAFKNGGRLGLLGLWIGYPLTRLILACIPFEGLPKAVQNGDIEQVRRLLDKGEDLDARDFWGNTALAHAAHLGHAAIVRLLLAKGADPKIRNLRRRQPRDLSEDSNIIQLLDGASTLVQESSIRSLEKDCAGSPSHAVSNTVD